MVSYDEDTPLKAYSGVATVLGDDDKDDEARFFEEVKSEAREVNLKALMARREVERIIEERRLKKLIEPDFQEEWA